MEPPTPQCVGREFVRQYYTLLNQAPLHLHRLESFYSYTKYQDPYPKKKNFRSNL